MPFGRFRARVQSLVIAAWVGLLVAPAPAYADDLASRIAAGELASAAKLLQDADYASSLRSDSSRLRDAAEAAGARAGMAGQRAEFAAVVDFLVKAGESAGAANSGDADAWWAVAEARAAAAVSSVAAGQKPPGDVWFLVHDAYEKAAKAQPPGDDARRRCIQQLLEGASNVSSQGNVVVSRALGVAQKALKDPATSAETRVAYVETMLAATLTLIQTDRSGAREAVKAGLALLSPACDGEKTPVEVGGLWNRLVTLDRRSRFGIGEKYVCLRITFLEGNYTIDLPIGRHWSPDDAVSGAKTGDWGERRDATRIVRTNDGGDRVGWISGLIYGFGWAYKSPSMPNPVSADNPGGVADLSVARFVRTFFKSLTSSKRPRKGKVGQAIPAFGYQIDGVGNADKPIRIHGWVFRGRALQTYEVVVVDELPSDDLDPEFDAVMDSVREVD